MHDQSHVMLICLFLLNVAAPIMRDEGYLACECSGLKLALREMFNQY